MPKVEEARLRMQHELQVARQQGYAAVKLIHGYGSSGVGGSCGSNCRKNFIGWLVQAAYGHSSREKSGVFPTRRLGASQALSGVEAGFRPGQSEQGNQHRAALNGEPYSQFSLQQKSLKICSGFSARVSYSIEPNSSKRFILGEHGNRRLPAPLVNATVLRRPLFLKVVSGARYCVPASELWGGKYMKDLQ